MYMHPHTCDHRHVTNTHATHMQPQSHITNTTTHMLTDTCPHEHTHGHMHTYTITDTDVINITKPRGGHSYGHGWRGHTHTHTQVTQTASRTPERHGELQGHTLTSEYTIMHTATHTQAA